MSSLLKKIIKFNRIVIVGITKGEDSDQFSLVEVQKKSNQIQIISQKTYLNLNELLEILKKDIPLILVVDGKGILNKKIDSTNEVDVNWNKNIDYQSIYYTSALAASVNYMSFCRRNIVDEYIEQFKQNSFEILDVFIGSFMSVILKAEIEKPIVLSNELILKFEDNLLVDFERNNQSISKKSYKIGDDEVASDFLHLYAAAVQFYILSDEISKTDFENLELEEVIYKRAFNGLGIFMLVFFLTALLISFFSIRYYSAENAQLNLENVYSKETYQTILNLEKQKANKNEILKQAGLLSSHFITYYQFEILKSIPQNIELKELSIFPLKDQIKENKKAEFVSGVIVVKGQMQSDDLFSNWLISLKRMDWIQNFEIKNLKKDKMNYTHFELHIKIK